MAEDASRLPSRITRVILVVAVVATVILYTAEAAAAKILPVSSVQVLSPTASTAEPVEVVVRYAPGFDLPDAAWENGEISVLPSSRTDADGWPRDRNVRGTPIMLHRIATGTYRGSVVIRQPGDYVVVPWSSEYAREDRLQGVVTATGYAHPVSVHVSAAAPVAATAARPARSTSSNALVAWIALAAVCALGAACFTARARSRRRVAPAPEPAAREPVSADAS